MDAARTGEQKAEAYRRWMEAAELQTITAEAKDTPDAWKAAMDASTKALSNATTDDEKRPAEEFLTRAQQRQSWILAKQADDAGDLMKALDLATTATGFRKAPKELADYLSTLQMRKKAADDRAARKAEFDRIAKLAKDEKEPSKAAELWKQALGTADEPADASVAQAALETLAPEIARVEDEKRKAELKRRAQASLDEAETALKAGNFDLADAKFKEAKPVLAAEADAGLGRVDAARRQKAYDDAIAEARDLQSQKQWARAKAACERALMIKQGDAVASDLLRAIEPNLVPESIEVKLGGTVMKFVRIRPGTFTMGDPDFRKQGFEDAIQHEVTLTRDYWMLTTEVTQAQWEAVMGSNPSKFKGAALPVESISYLDAASFVARLNEKAADQLGRRKAAIPTEAEWEYAARGGATTPWHFGASESAIGDYGWVKANAGGKTHPVAEKKPNAWGLYDVHGNVFEWCSDWNAPFTTAKATDPAGPGEGQYRGSRGGCFSYDAQYSRCGFRGKPAPTAKLESQGVRILVK
jgi:formylglycine-generating enzyme required for sulfatase activity